MGRSSAPARLRYLLLYPAVVLGTAAAAFAADRGAGVAFFGPIPMLASLAFGAATLPLAGRLRRGSSGRVARFALTAAALTLAGVALLLYLPVGTPRPFSATVYLLAVVPLGAPALATWAAYWLSGRAGPGGGPPRP